MADDVLHPRKPKEIKRGGISQLPGIDILDDVYYRNVFDEFFVPPTLEQRPIWVANSLANLNLLSVSEREDGDIGMIRLGSWPNVNEEYFTFNQAVDMWVGEVKLVLGQLDRWSMNLGDKPQSALTNWNYFSNPNPNGSDAFILLNGSHDFNAAAFSSGTGTVSVQTGGAFGLSTNPFSSNGTLHIANNRITYGAKTSNSFTSCMRTFPSGAGAGSVCAHNTDVIQGPQGGWGTLATPIPFAKEMSDAGFALQERMAAFMNPSPETVRKVLEIAPYWVCYDDGDGSNAPTDPPVGGIGFSASLFSGTTTVDKPQERPFYMQANNWSNFPALTITKRYMQPRLYGRMASGALDSGQVLDTKLHVRWVGAANSP